MTDRKKLVLGVCVTGTNEYWALAFLSLLSVKTFLDTPPTKIMIATDQTNNFSQLKNLEDMFGCHITQIIPRDFYSSLVPKMKGNYSTYWKFDLFNAIKADEVLMYVDVDAFAIRELRISNIVSLLAEGAYSLAAVPSPRPVLERVAATRIRNPFDYFNAGVLFGTTDVRYQISNLKAAYTSIMQFDTLNVYWHDQDIFNYLFRDDTFKLPYAYNVHTGYLLKKFRASYLLNDLAAGDINQSAMIIHVSGDFLLSRKFHPYKRQFAKLIENSLYMLNDQKNLSGNEWSELREALIRLHGNAVRTSVDYLFQCFYLRRRLFASRFYFPNFKLYLRKIKRYTQSI